MPECLELVAMCTLLCRLIDVGTDSMGKYVIHAIKTKGKRLYFELGDGIVIDIHFMLKGYLQVTDEATVPMPSDRSHHRARLEIYPPQCVVPKLKIDLFDPMHETEIHCFHGFSYALHEINLTFFHLEDFHLYAQENLHEWDSFSSLARNRNIKTMLQQKTGPWWGIGKFLSQLWVTVLQQFQPELSETSKAKLITKDSFLQTTKRVREILMTEYQFLTTTDDVIARVNELYSFAHSRRQLLLVQAKT